MLGKELRIFTTILLLAIIFLQTFSSFVIQADYFLNKGYIAKVLCVNKNKPKLHCNGKCYLAKKLKEQEKQEQQSPGTKKIKLEIPFYFLPKQFNFAGIRPSDKEEYQFTNDFMTAAFYRSVFHPPTV
jgi:hypothetical protein